MATETSDSDRLKQIVAAFLHCHQIPTVEEVGKQFKYETGRRAEVKDVERAIVKG